MSVSEIRSLDRKSVPSRPWAHRLPPPIVMMGVPIDQLNTSQALGIAEEMIASGTPHVIATANVDFLAQVQEDAALQRILHDADLILCDGTPLVWMSKWLGDPLPERLAGSDLVPLLLDLAQEKGYRVFFLGGRDEVIAVAEEKIQARWPKLQIAGMYSPPFAPIDKMDHEGICRRIREAKPDMLFVSFGCPKQEKWLAMNFRDAGVPVAMGVGATIDFLAGTVKRAPVWMRKTGLEWVFRVLQEPRRLASRYWTDIRVVVPGLLRQYLRMRFSDKPASASSPTLSTDPVASNDSAPTVIRLPERLDAVAAREASFWPAETLHSVIIDARDTLFIDSTGSGKLARLARTTREHGGKCILAGATKPVLATLELMKLRHLFIEAATVDEAIEVSAS
jgi:exopolysaccharide biosynthesis WecB/TagA/CpsF family protein